MDISTLKLDDYVYVVFGRDHLLRRRVVRIDPDGVVCSYNGHNMKYTYDEIVRITDDKSPVYIEYKR